MIEGRGRCLPQATKIAFGGYKTFIGTSNASTVQSGSRDIQLPLSSVPRGDTKIRKAMERSNDGKDEK
jgi:hypothetical protein